MCSTTQTSDLWTTTTENTKTLFQTILSETSLLEAEGANNAKKVWAGIHVEGECI